MAEKIEPSSEGWVESVALAEKLIAWLTHADKLRRKDPTFNDEVMIKQLAEWISHEDLAGLCRSLQHVLVVKTYTKSLVPAELFKIMDEQNRLLKVWRESNMSPEEVLTMFVISAARETRHAKAKEGRVILYDVLVNWTEYIDMFNAESALKFSDTQVVQALEGFMTGKALEQFFEWLRLNPFMDKHVNEMHDLSLEHQFQQR
uniref:RxLR effector candidate protein n=2 Tax=Hyaloperonospora arabidopsidis (strain Emoy2) TaxID=559515 RepID=M4BY94_HYAAE